MIDHDALNVGTRSQAPLAGKRRLLKPSRLVRSPAFTTTYPRITNLELIEPSIRAVMDTTWSTTRFEERHIEVFQIKNGYVIDENLVLDENLQIIANVDDSYTPEELQRAVDDIEKRLEARDLPHLDGIGIVAKRRAANNYGHYLLYMLPLALLGKSLFGDRNPRYLTHCTAPSMRDVTLRSLRLLGINLDRVLMLDFREPVRFEEVVFFTGFANHGSYLSPLAVQAVVDMAAEIPAGLRRKLFVRRIPGWRRGRAMFNEGDIARRLAARGFHVIEPGTMSLEEQIATFKGAEHVVGSLGAGMANIVFCQPGTNVTVLSSGMFPDTFFWFIAMHRQLNYHDIRGDHFHEINDFGSMAVDFMVREKDILRLEGLGKTSTQATASASPNSTIRGASVLAHVRNVGDLVGPLGLWMGVPNSQRWIEGFAINLPEQMALTDIEYQAVLGAQSLSPVATGGMFCGSRGNSLPIRGLRVRALGELATRYVLLCSATFVDHNQTELAASGEICAAHTYAPLETFKITLHKRA